MSKLRHTKTNFTAGELSTDLLGRGDLAAYENGAAKLRNVFIQPTGGVTRRAGLRYLDTVPGTGRLIPFAFNTEQVYLLVFTDQWVDVYMDGLKMAGFAAPWTADQLPHIGWTQSADTLLVVHPEVETRAITRTAHTEWSLDRWFYEDGRAESGLPFEAPAASGISLWAVEQGPGVVLMETSAAYFTSQHKGMFVRFRGVDVEYRESYGDTLFAVRAPTAFPDLSATTDWQVSIFGGTKGWPGTVTFHQDRLVFGGSPSRPNHVWLSRIGVFHDIGSGGSLDDDPIDFPVLSDQVNAVRHVFSGRHLQIFTTGGEWTVSGEPLTPSTAEVRRQTRVGAFTARRVPPRDVDGATLFAAANGRELREFLFTDLEQAYQSADLALLARHLFDDPVDMDYDPVRRLIHVVMGDGSLATVTNFRREKVTAWTRQETAGLFRAVAVAGRDTYALVERANGVFLELFDDALETDAALTGTHDPATATWSGLDHLEGQTVTVKADGAEVDDAVVSAGAVTLADPASEAEIGLAFTHVVEPLPPLPDGPRGGGNGRQMRLVRASFRLLETPVLKVDVGRGPTALTFKRFGASGVLDSPPPPFTGDATVRAVGWQRDAVKPLWRIEQDTPHSCTVLSVTTETKVTD